MKLFICSDLHIDALTPAQYRNFTLPPADVYLIAGDHMNGVVESHYRWLIQKTNGIPTYLTMGNHDYYGLTREDAIKRIRQLVWGSSIQLVFNESVLLAPGLQLWASDFWTDLALTGNRERVVAASRAVWDDFDEIHVREGVEFRCMRTDDMVAWHQAALAQFVEFQAQTDDDILLMSHHGLCPEALARNLMDEPLTEVDAFFTSDARDRLLGLTNAPLLLIHGHVHRYHRTPLTARTTAFCNPRGTHGTLRHTLVELEHTGSRWRLIGESDY